MTSEITYKSQKGSAIRSSEALDFFRYRRLMQDDECSVQEEKITMKN
jgi:hypothetical protein